MTKRMFGILALAGTLVGSAAPSARAASYPERLVFDGNVLWNNMQAAPTQLPWGATSGPCTLGVAMTYSTTQLGTVHFTRNRTNADPMLTAPFHLTSPRWDPQQLSPLNCDYSTDAVVLDVASLDAWFQQTDHVGAIPYRFPDPARDWTTGWIYTNTGGGFGRTDVNYAKPLVILSGVLATTTLSASNNYLLRGKVEVAPGHSLTIPAGTYLFGERATTGYLVVNRGAKIFVNGTASAPVVITSDQDPSSGLMAPGDNGGLVIHGRARANCANTAAGDSCVSEGGAGAYGGNDDEDDSGVIRYLRIEYSGKTISPDNELNSLTMNAVGRGTTIEYVNACLGSDDAFEWFGGSARASRLVAWGTDDDGLDWQMGWRGRVQFAVVQQHPGRGDKGIEADNNEFNFQAQPRSSPMLANLTLVGTNPPTAGAGSSNIGIHLRRGTAATVVNSVILGFRGPGLTVSDPETFANCPGAAPPVHCQPSVTAVASQETALPRSLSMTASPNPLRSGTDIRFGLPSDQRHVRVQIFDARGRLVETLAQGPMSAGVHRFSWAPRLDLPAGQYFFRVAGDQGGSASGKLVLVR